GTYTFEMRAVDAVSPGEFYSDTKSFSIVISQGSSGGGSGSTPHQCADNADNDGDGFTDYPSDTGCESYGDNDESNGQNNSPFQCNNAGDDDGDGLVDMSDPGCQTPFDNNEYNVETMLPACSDGVDNDGDEDIDFSPGSGGDSGCISPFDQSEVNTLTPVLPDDDTPIEEVLPDPNDDGGPVIDDPNNPDNPIVPDEPELPGDENPNDGPTVLGEVDRCDVDLPANATVFQVIQNEVIHTFCIVRDITEDTYDQVDRILNAPNLNPLAQIIAVVGLVMGAVFSVAPVLFLNPFSFTEVVFIPYRIWTLILNAFGLKKRNRPWGTVYDSVTKQPLDPVIVALYDVQGKEVATSITDMDGRYGFLVPPGSYRMVAKKTHYQFPSIKLAGKTRDELYLDLYYGTEIEVKSQGDVLIRNIPMDPIGFDWNEFAKRDQKLMKFFSKKDLVIARISDAFFGLGFFFSVIALLTGPTFYNIFIFGTYVFFMVVRETGVSRKAFGSVKTLDGVPVPFAILRIFTSGSDTEVAHKVTNELGKYFCLIQNGNYYVTIEKKNADETYTKVHTTPSIEVKNGLIREKVTLR
ncbi:MAG: Carboxypeptidase regulatory-like protein, partial [Patescibacteria group bacterium]|nr:Carboxypeptidase regulatory-like protein [Patescibacteria group bacterium]